MTQTAPKRTDSMLKLSDIMNTDLSKGVSLDSPEKMSSGDLLLNPVEDPFIDEVQQALSSLNGEPPRPAAHPGGRPARVTYPRECPNCCQMFASKSLFLTHRRKCDPGDMKHTSKHFSWNVCMYPNCFRQLTNHNVYLAHLKEVHKLDAEIQVLYFKNRRKFLRWKRKESGFYFMERRTPANGFMYTYYSCRYNKFDGLETKIGPNNVFNVNETCISHMIVKDTNAGLTVSYYPVHNHRLDPRYFGFLKLSREYNRAIAAMLMQGRTKSEVFLELSTLNDPCAQLLTPEHIEQMFYRIFPSKRYVRKVNDMRVAQLEQHVARKLNEEPIHLDSWLFDEHSYAAPTQSILQSAMSEAGVPIFDTTELPRPPPPPPPLIQETKKKGLVGKYVSESCNICDHKFTPDDVSTHYRECDVAGTTKEMHFPKDMVPTESSNSMYPKLCHFCGNFIRNKVAAYRHQSRCLGSKKRAKPPPLQCSTCQKKFTTVWEVTEHEEKAHRDPNSTIFLTFHSEKEFSEWLHYESTSNFVQFNKKLNRPQNGSRYGHFFCQFSAPKALNDSTKRARYIRPPAYYNCPSNLLVKVSQRIITVKYNPVHSHPLNFTNLKYQQLQKSTLDFIYSKIDEGYRPDQILGMCIAGEGCSTPVYRKEYFLTKRRIQAMASKRKRAKEVATSEKPPKKTKKKKNEEAQTIDE